MKSLNTTFPTAILLGLMSAAEASDIQAMPGAHPTTESRDVVFHIQDGIATLTGSVEDSLEKETMEIAASRLEGVAQVQNYLAVTR